MSAFHPLQTLAPTASIAWGVEVMQALIVELIALVATAVGHLELSPAGDYLCTVGQKAGIAGIHLEGAGPPSAFAKVGPATKFKMRITLEPKRPKPLSSH
jgi:hypothetical protein